MREYKTSRHSVISNKLITSEQQANIEVTTYTFVQLQISAKQIMCDRKYFAICLP